MAWDIARIARDKGWRVGVLCVNADPAGVSDGVSEHEGIMVVRYPKRAAGPFNSFGMVLQIRSARAAFNRRLRGIEWDLVHIHSPFTGAGVMRALGRRTRYVYTVHSPIVSEQQINWSSRGLPGKVKLVLGLPLLEALERYMLSRASVVHALSEYTRKEVQRFHGCGERVSVIPHWAPTASQEMQPKSEARKNLGWREDTGSMVFFTVRNHRERYGIDVAIKALAGLLHHKWTFYVGGDGPLRPYLENLVLSLGLADRVIFCGRLSDEALALAYQAADMFILPTVALECFGLITLESMSFGCPVVATDSAALPETLRPITPDLIVPAADVGALMDKLKDIMEGRVARPSPEELRAYVDSRYRKPVIARLLLSLLESACTEPTTAGLYPLSPCSRC